MTARSMTFPIRALCPASIPNRWLKKVDKKVIAEIEDCTPWLVAASPVGKTFQGAVINDPQE
jgi:hypothetical protein